ncbi:helix-turn-helix domain-containing protein [Salinirubellus sp. GCM10025818]|uniref:helix-turn-helix domain-containing protein n=1 Tax=Salinirubellus TaxID=2162630 RepID=UPI0030CC2276
MKEYLQQDMACEGLLECFHGLKGLDRKVFEVLADAEQALTVDEIATAVKRERSTAYRSIQRLLGAGILQKEQINYDHGGYYHVYRVADSSDMAQHMQRMLNDWYAQMGQLIQEFEDKYEGAGSIEVSS